ncbi:MAG: FAD-dependent monooxygenase [Kiloniellales bacterium]
MSSADDEKCPVLIVGAGPTGLALAVELVRHGIRSRIFDKATQPSETSKALAVQARTLEFFERMGVVKEALRRGFRFPAVNMYIDKKPRFRLDIAEIDSPYPFALTLSQAETEAILTAKLAEAGVAIERAATLTSFEEKESVVEARLQHDGGRDERVRASYIVGCDGAHSAVRHCLDLPFEGAPYEEDFMLADVKIEWSLPREGQGFIEGGNLLVALPMADSMVRLIATRAEGAAGGAQPTLDDFRKLLGTMATVPARISDPAWIAPFRLHRRMVPQLRVGGAFLAGDAAHIHSPAGGQGMNTGIQDACNLAWKLALVLKGQAPESLLDSYHDERHPVARDVLEATNLMFKSVTLKNPLLRPLRDLLLPLFLGVPAIQRRLRSFVSELAISYRGISPILGESLGGGGRFNGGPAPGERAPDTTLNSMGKGTRLFQRLDPCRHTLLLFGGDQGSLAAARALAGRDRPPVSVLEIGESEGNAEKRYGVIGPSLYLVRPDGYVAFRAAPADVGQLGSYLECHYGATARAGREAKLIAPDVKEA